MPRRKQPEVEPVLEGPTPVPGISLTINSEEITHPNFPIRWKLSTAMLERITTGLKEGRGYAILISATRDEYNSRHSEVRGVNEPLQYFRLIEVPRAGTWNFSVFLFERTSVVPSGKRSTAALTDFITNTYMKKNRDWHKASHENRYNASIGFAEFYLPAQEGSDSKRHFSVISDYPQYGVMIAMDTIAVTIPNTIFAPDPPKWLADYGNYFYRKRRPYDQCDFAWRLVYMIPGFFLWLALELTKRTLLGVLALLAFLFCFKDWWKVGDQALEPAVNVQLRVKDFDTDGIVEIFDGSPGIFLTPGMLVLYGLVCAGAMYCFTHFVKPVLALAAQGLENQSVHESRSQILIIAGVVIVSLFLFFFSRFTAYLKKLWKDGEPARYKKAQAHSLERDARNRERTLELGAVDAAQLQQYAATLTEAPAITVALEAVPEALRPKDFNWWNLLKREHCAPFGGS